MPYLSVCWQLRLPDVPVAQRVHKARFRSEIVTCLGKQHIRHGMQRTPSTDCRPKHRAGTGGRTT